MVSKLTEQQQRDLMTKQAALTALTKHPSWPMLETIVDDKVERLEDDAVHRVFAPNGLDPIYQSYLRGFRDGLRYIVKVPKGAERRLEDLLKAQTSQRGRNGA